jgi:hypothetical protein
MTKNTKLKQSKRQRRMRREYGIGDFLDHIHSDIGLAAAVRKIAKEEQLFLQFDGKDKPVH